MSDDVAIIDTRIRSIKEYEPFCPILDRVLIRHLEENPSDEFQSLIPEKYRQHTNRGEVVAVGDAVVLGDSFVNLADFVDVGDIVLYGEYSSERFKATDDDSLPDGEYYIVRIQDIRGVRKLKRG